MSTSGYAVVISTAVLLLCPVQGLDLSGGQKQSSYPRLVCMSTSGYAVFIFTALCNNVHFRLSNLHTHNCSVIMSTSGYPIYILTVGLYVHFRLSTPHTHRRSGIMSTSGYPTYILTAAL